MKKHCKINVKKLTKKTILVYSKRSQTGNVRDKKSEGLKRMNL